ncbi:hypothetical protein PG990_002896 [Apiospora arundinis]
MAQQTTEPPPNCLCNDDDCQCAIEVLRDMSMQALHHASQEDVSDRRLRFFPLESVLVQINPDFVRKVLRKVADIGQDITEALERATNRISPHVCYCSNLFCTGNRVTFASLLFVGLHGILVQYLHAAQPESCDSFLWRLSRQKSAFGDRDPIFQRIQQLDEGQRELFYHWAYQLRALCLPRKVSHRGRVEMLGLEDGVEDRDEPTNVFALKTIKSYTPEASFKLELDINNDVPPSDRILSLKAAFEHRGNFYLLFPWAELGDLRGIWKRFSSTPDKATGQLTHATWYSSQWLLEECHGIASAVAELHGFVEPTPRSPIFHADIKPENILVFLVQGRAFLKLADFGHSHVMKESTLNIVASPMMNALSYRAPEYDTQDSVTIKYDVWSLGCVFLEFATWALEGREKVDSFETARVPKKMDLKANFPTIKEDTFFKRVAGSRGPFSWSLKSTTNRQNLKGSFKRELGFTLPGISRSVVTQVREPVSLQIKNLRSITPQDDLVHKLLGIIQTDMLVIDDKKRASSDKIRAMTWDIIPKPETGGQPH